MEVLVNATRQNLSTGFGSSQEEDALDLYEGLVGCGVRERNEALMTWRFERSVVNAIGESGEGMMGGGVTTARPLGEARRREWGEMMSVKVHDVNCKNDNVDIGIYAVKSEEKSIDKEVEVIDLTHTSSSAAIVDTSPPSHPEQQQQEQQRDHCFFKIVGAVDGIRDEIYIDPAPSPPTDTNKGNNASSDTMSKQCHNSQHDNIPSNNNQNTQQSMNDEYNFSDDDDTNNEQWTIRPIIVECKHRMSQAKVPPPLYDQIQTW